MKIGQLKTILSCIMLSFAPLWGHEEVQDLELVNTKTGFVALEFQDGETIIHDRFLKAAVEKEGILIPHQLREAYGGKERVFLTDALFQKAFRDVFYEVSLDKTAYEWHGE